VEVIGLRLHSSAALALALIAFVAAGGEAEAVVPIKVDNPEVLVVAFDYDGLAPMVTQISFILYTDGTFALLRHGSSTGDEPDAFVQGKIDAAEALDLATQAHADLKAVTSNIYSLKDMAAEGGFEVWYWNPADRLYWHPIVAGHPCDAAGDAPVADGLPAFCRHVAALRDRGSLEQHPVRTSFLFTKAEGAASETRSIPDALGAKEIDSDIPIVGICTDGQTANAKAAELIAPNGGNAVAYRFDDLPPLELTQIIRATYLPKAYEVPLGDEMNSVGDPCNGIRASRG
jgi:hypothetical protein